jgi:hypothetical protein
MARNIPLELQLLEVLSTMNDNKWREMVQLQGIYIYQLPGSRSFLMERVFRKFDKLIAVIVSLEAQSDEIKETHEYMQARVTALNALWTLSTLAWHTHWVKLLLLCEI